MRKKPFLLFSLVLFILILLTPCNLKGAEFVFFLSGNYAGGLDVGDTNYSMEKDNGYLVINDSGSITSGSVSSFAGSQVGAQLFFTPHIGISLSSNIYFKKAEFDLDSSYTYHWEAIWGWENTENAAWTGTGDMQVTPINLNLVFSYPLFSKMNINITAGGTYFVTKLNMNTNIGYGNAVIQEFEGWTLMSWDWYILELENKQSKNFLGGNFGLDFEYKVSPSLSLRFIEKKG